MQQRLTKLFQYDTWASDISSSGIKIADYVPTTPYPKYFGRMERAPDGKIYMDLLNGTSDMHVIHSPDELGVACNFERSAYQLLSNSWYFAGLPNQPNWRLGPVDGSSCDTLGIDNIPWAHWRWRSDAQQPLKMRIMG